MRLTFSLSLAILSSALPAQQPTRAPATRVARAVPPAPTSPITLDSAVFGGLRWREVGPGLAFAESDQPNWQETMEMRVLKATRTSKARTADHVEVEIRLADILRQGGLVYPVESVTVERAWYCTLPEGSIEVKQVD